MMCVLLLDVKSNPEKKIKKNPESLPLNYFFVLNYLPYIHSHNMFNVRVCWECAITQVARAFKDFICAVDTWHPTQLFQRTSSMYIHMIWPRNAQKLWLRASLEWKSHPTSLMCLPKNYSYLLFYFVVFLWAWSM